MARLGPIAGPRNRTTLERMFENRCPDCRSTVTVPALPGDATCPRCGLSMYVTDGGLVGRYPPEGWEPGPIQGYSHRPD
jgi:hypothetical protein